MSLTSDLKSPRTPVGRWARDRFPHTKALYPALNDASEPVRVRPDGWGDGTDQRWSWAGMACDTMLRWRLGVTGPESVVQAGGRRLVGDLGGRPLGRLLDTAPDLHDTAAAARIAALWALAEQHARYGPTENPLTDVADRDETTLLGCVPDEVVDDVAAVADGPAADLADAIGGLGPVTAGIAFAYPGGADLDLLAGTTLVEVKTTTSRRGLVDVLQPLGYALLAEPGQIDTLMWAFARSGKYARITVADTVDQAVDTPGTTVDTLREELIEVAQLPR